MKSKICILFMFLFSYVYASSLEGKYWGEIKDDDSGSYHEVFYSFEKGKYTLEMDLTGSSSMLNISNEYIKYDGKQKIYRESGKYELFSENGFNYILFRNSTSYCLKEKLGYMVFDKFCILYEGNKIVFQSLSNYFDESPLIELKNITTSSFLTDGKTLYNAENFMNIINEFQPWVEGVSGPGIDEWIEMTFDCSDDQNNKLAFLLSNGYVNSLRNDLYYANNRIKQLQVACDELKINQIIQVSDVPDIKILEIPYNSNYKGTVTVRFIIKDVYKGNKYDDTCVSLIVPVNK